MNLEDKQFLEIVFDTEISFIKCILKQVKKHETVVIVLKKWNNVHDIS